MDNPGYHLRVISKGTLGEISKIQEELDELQDAMDQRCKIMCLIELSDLIGAVEAYMERYLPGNSIEDLRTMSKITKRAFESGRRK